MTRTDAVRLNDVLDSIILIEGYTAGMTVQQFESDWLRQDAVVQATTDLPALRAAVERALRDASGNSDHGDQRRDARENREP